MGSVGAVGASIAIRPTWDKSKELEPSVNQPTTVHVLGEKLDNEPGRLIRSISDDVFDRLCQNVTGPIYLTESDRPGSTADMPNGTRATMMRQLAIAVRIEARYASDRPPVFNLEGFRHWTNYWSTGGGGLMIAWPPRDFAVGSDPHGKPTREAFEGIVACGQLSLPRGMEWSANYVDEKTGMCMRVVFAYEMSMDDYQLRYDVLCG